MINPTLMHGIVLGYGQFQNTSQRCLDSLLGDAQRLNIPVTIFDNGSPDNSPQLQTAYKEQHPYLLSHLSKINLGFAGGMNQASQSIDTKWLLLIGSDTIFTKGALESLYQEVANAAGDVGLICPVSNNAGNAQKITFESNEFALIEEVLAKDWAAKSELKCPIYRADFFCVAIRRSLWDRLGGLDLSYGRGYYEDFDFCMRAKKIGYSCLMLEDAFIYHAGSSSFKMLDEQRDLIRKNKKIFISKHPNAKLRHLREENFNAIDHYLKNIKADQITPGMCRVINYRVRSLKESLPKSFLKKILWKFKINQLTKRITKTWQISL